jgi:hypothetical protein
MKNYDEEIKEATAALDKLREAKAVAEKKQYEAGLNRIRPLAERYHDLCCNYNHRDGCGWGYEGDNWESYAHNSWLQKTALLIGVIPPSYYEREKTVMSEEIFVKLLDAYENIKKIHPSAAFLFRKIT